MRLNRRAVGHRLVRVDAVVQLLAAKVVGQQLTDTRDARGASHHHDLVNVRLAHLGIAEEAVERRNRALEERVAQTLKLGARDCRLEVLALRETIHLHRRLRGGREAALRLLARRAETAEGTGVI